MTQPTRKLLVLALSIPLTVFVGALLLANMAVEAWRDMRRKMRRAA